ncbi:TldD/PmbA family protein [Halocynthiibacter styelae]|uniref:TldD/PmbA family protein n=1 Tax=Halocynthiibacter styelae TaxID=2761955 RepID=A0A8J7J7T1_9RHOB|nr:TldD/PmbA family protein [Paenihalocynthiibacter styelae]MBI1494760.1 TldD/PmbA family protein [Paenihalocynthiibacter styelae]
MTQTLSDITDALITAARKAGADHADALAVEGQSVSIDVRDGALEHAERSEGTDIGLRVFIGKRTAVVSSSDTRTDTIAQMAERAVAMAKEAPEDPWTGLAETGEFAARFDVSALELEDTSDEPSPKALEEDACRAEAAAQAVEGITQVQSASAGYGRHSIHLATSNGFGGGYARTNRGISCVAITGEGTGMERDYYGDSRIFQNDLISPEEIGRIAAERTVERKGARKPATGTYPVIFDERISSSLIGHLLGASNGASVARGSSWLKDSLGEPILPEGLTLREDPHRARVGGSRPFDGEGMATRPRNIVENGVLTGWTLDLATARQLGMESTASASRGTSSGPSPTAGNVTLTQGNKTLEDLKRDMGTGLLVTSMIGSTINPNTGDYSRGASGFWIENGELQYPVNECTIAGNLRDMLMRIIPANDARTHLSRVVPSLMIEGMTLAGS